MNAETYSPKSLMEAVQYFSDASVATDFFVAMRWIDGVTCPHCGSKDVLHLPNQRRWKCRTKHPKQQFSAKVGTIFEESPLGLDKWFVAVWCISNAKNGISSCELARALGVTQKSAWFMLHRVRHAMSTGTFEKFSGTVESDETYIGGEAKNMHLSRRQEKIKGTGGMGKEIVHGLIERGDKKTKVNKKTLKLSKVKATVVSNARKNTLVPIIQEHVASGSTVYTDSLQSYNAIADQYIHDFVNHASINGTYVSVDAPHLQRYVDEQAFRFNERKFNDGQRFSIVLPGTIGKRITYKELIGANDAESLPGSDAAENAGLPN